MKNSYFKLASAYNIFFLLVSIFIKTNQNTKKIKTFFVITFGVFAFQNLIGQINVPGGASCNEASPLCYDSGSSYIFNNITSGNLGELECLDSTPGPAWFYLKIDNPGNLVFRISQGADNDNNGQIDPSSDFDVDFVAFGPYSSPNGNCGNLAGFKVDCSFSSSSTETLTINNAKAGEYYMLLITNYKGDPGIIVVTQTNESSSGSGSTDCSIINVDGILGPDQEICEPNEIILDANPNNDSRFANYSWEVNTGSGFNAVPNTNGKSKISVKTSGEYRVTIKDNNNNSDYDTVLITVKPTPVGRDFSQTTCSNKSLNIDLTALTNIASSYVWKAKRNPKVGRETTSPSTNNTIRDDLKNTSGVDQNVIYTVTPTSLTSNCTGDDFTINVTVNSRSIPTFDLIPNEVCEGSNFSLPTTSTNGIRGSWAPAFDNTQSTTYTFTPDASECATTQTLRVEITPKTVPAFDPIAAVCEGTTLSLPTTSTNSISGSWAPAFDNTQSTTYTFTPDASECATTQTLRVEIKKPEILKVSSKKFSESFGKEQNIEVRVKGGNGHFEYQLDNGVWQTSPIFKNVTDCKEHFIKVRELGGCSQPEKISIYVYDHPKYFTPNGDGYNDYWKIECFKNKNATITIFDRFGKLLSKFESKSQGWDGRWNGALMPSSDYWFVVEYYENSVKKQFKSHFSLKR